jgi:3-oxoacyl-[acyl-carrier protein] reductase
VVVADVQRGEGEAVAADCPGGWFQPLDVVSEGDWREAMAVVAARCGRLDVVFNNAGIVGGRGIEDMDLANWDRVIGINLTGVMLGCREAIRLMKRNPEGPVGSIINTASIYGLRGAVSSAAYGPTKAAMIGMTMQLATEYGRDGIRVNAVAPGLIVTPMTAGRLANNPAFRDDMIGRTPLGHPGAPEDIAKAVLFLASDDARFITGVTLPVDGGWSVAGYLPPA